MVFLPGWGQSSLIWQHQANYFSQFTPVISIELPGHGGTADVPPEAWLDIIARQLPDKPSILIGWSLGGMLAMQLAKSLPERIAALALVSTTPCFHERPDWPNGCPTHIFQAFEQGVSSHSTKQLGSFFAMMLHGDDLPRSRINELVHLALDRKHPPTIQSLKNGLSLLSELDLRKLLADLNKPVWVVHGDRDTVVPLAAGQYLATKLPHATGQYFKQCGHAPFLTQSKIFNNELEAWCRNISRVNE